MKKLFIVLVVLLSFQNTKAQTNSVGKTEFQVCLDVLGRDSSSNCMRSNSWKQGDTLVVSVSYVERPLGYNPIFYFMKGVCVKQRIIYINDNPKYVSAIYDYTKPEDVVIKKNDLTVKNN